MKITLSGSISLSDVQLTLAIPPIPENYDYTLTDDAEDGQGRSSSWTQGATSVTCGNTNSEDFIALSFPNFHIPAGTVITSADLTFEITAVIGTQKALRYRAFSHTVPYSDSNRPQQFVTPHGDYTEPSQQNYNVGSKTITITEAIQELLDNVAYVQDQWANIMFNIFSPAGGPEVSIAAHEHSTGVPARLLVTI